MRHDGSGAQAAMEFLQCVMAAWMALCSSSIVLSSDDVGAPLRPALARSDDGVRQPSGDEE